MNIAAPRGPVKAGGSLRYRIAPEMGRPTYSRGPRGAATRVPEAPAVERPRR